MRGEGFRLIITNIIQAVHELGNDQQRQQLVWFS